MPLGRSWPRVLAVLAAAAAITSALYEAPDAFRRLDGQRAANATLSRSQRALLPARSVDIATELFTTAKELLPPDATYTVITGPGVEVGSSLTLFKVPAFAPYWLLPRRFVTSDTAQWVLSYGGDLSALGLRYQRVVDVLPGLQIAEVAR